MDTPAFHRACGLIFLPLLCALSSAHAVNLAPEGTGIIGVNDSVDLTDLGTPLVHAGVAGAINDGNLNSHVDTYGNGSQGYSYVGVEWPDPRPEAVKTLVLTMATFFDGGWFGPNGSSPGAGGALTATHLVAPSIQVSTDFSATWTTVPSTSTYVGAFVGHRIGGGGVVNPSKRSATFTLEVPQAGITGIRLIGRNGGTADGNGFIGVFELAVQDVGSANDADDDGLTDTNETSVHHTDPNDPDSDDDGLIDGDEIVLYLTNPLAADTDGDRFNDGIEVQQGTSATGLNSRPDNIALVGRAIIGTHDALDADEGTPFAHAGAAANINDGSPVTRVDTYDGVGGGGDTFSYAGIVWPPDLGSSIGTLTVTLATFHDGGWFGPNGIGPGSGGTLDAALHLTAPTVQITYDEGLTWGPAVAMTNYISAVDGHPLPAVDNGPPTPVTFIVVFDPPLAISETAVHGVRLIGPEGGTASNGFLGVFEFAVSPDLVSSDTDGDGQTDAAEVIAGTSPANPNDSLRITSVQRAGNQIVVTWTSVPGKRYRLQWSEANTLVLWPSLQSELLAAAAPATTTQTTFTFGAPPLPTQFYVRIAVESP